jgi:hypothetical protein
MRKRKLRNRKLTCAAGPKSPCAAQLPHSAAGPDFMARTRALPRWHRGSPCQHGMPRLHLPPLRLSGGPQHSDPSSPRHQPHRLKPKPCKNLATHLESHNRMLAIGGGWVGADPGYKTRPRRPPGTPSAHRGLLAQEQGRKKKVVTAMAIGRACVSGHGRETRSIARTRENCTYLWINEWAIGVQRISPRRLTPPRIKAILWPVVFIAPIPVSFLPFDSCWH